MQVTDKTWVDPHYADDVIHFIERYCRRSDPIHGMVAFNLRPNQKTLLKSFEVAPVTVIDKDRQTGISTLLWAHALWAAMLQDDQQIVYATPKLEQALKAAIAIRKMFASLPDHLALGRLTGDKFNLRFSNGSTIMVRSATINNCRSISCDSYDLIVLDSAAFMRDFESIWASIYPIACMPGSRVIVASTHNSKRDKGFQSLLEHAKRTDNPWKACRIERSTQ